MEFNKAIFFHNYLKTACESFYGIIEYKSLGEAQVNGTIVTFTNEEFDRYYHDFKSELRLNSLEIQDLEIIFEYVSCNFSDIISWNGFEKNINQIMVSSQFEIKYLKQLKENIEFYVGKIKEMGVRDRFGDINEEFETRIDWYLLHPNEENDDILFDRKIKVFPHDYDLMNYINTDKFDFFEVKFDSDKIANLVDRINFLEERLKEYRQILNKKKKDSIDKTLLSQDKDFEKLCVIEIDSLHRKLELDIKTGKRYQITENEMNETEFKGKFIWSASDTDLLELITALHKKESIQRKDGKTLTRKELTDYFQQLFGMEIKDVEGKLNKATNRKMNMTPFLDSLKVAFENYAEDKDEKQRKRK